MYKIDYDRWIYDGLCAHGGREVQVDWLAVQE